MLVYGPTQHLVCLHGVGGLPPALESVGDPPTDLGYK